MYKMLRSEEIRLTWQFFPITDLLTTVLRPRLVPSPTRESPRIREEEEIGAGSDSDLRPEDDVAASGVGLFECVSEGEKRSVALRL